MVKTRVCPIAQQIGFIAGWTQYLFKRDLRRTSRAMFWLPSVKEIGDWIEATYLKFAEQENKDPCRSADFFLQRYIFSNVHEIFFGTIHIELH